MDSRIVQKFTLLLKVKGRLFMKRIGILTSGGDCQGLNAAIRGVCKTLYNHYKKDEIEIYGIIDGYRGLITGEYRLMKPEDFLVFLLVEELFSEPLVSRLSLCVLLMKKIM